MGKLNTNKIKIPTLIGIVVLVIGITTGVLLVSSKQIFRLGAQGTNPPKNVRISNITGDSFTATWTTQEESVSSLFWGSDRTNLTKLEIDEIAGAGFTHSTTVRGLTPQKIYYFIINSGDKEYDNNDIPWQVTTGAQLAQPEAPNIISGSVLTATGTPATNALIHIQVGGTSPLSTITSENGSWVITLSSLRTADLNSYHQINESADIIEISAQAGPTGVSSAQIYTESAKPVPPLILGQVHDHKNLPPSQTEEVPGANPGLPSNNDRSSGFNVDYSVPESTPSAVTLVNIDEGETVSSVLPEFFGVGPPGIEIDITIESDPMTASIDIDENGTWSWSPDENLDPGSHTISITWIDTEGILQSITKNFVVQASEVPVYEATPSALPTPEVATPTASPIPTATSAATPPPQPKSGIAKPTLILYFMGMGLLTISGAIVYFAFEDKSTQR